MSIENKRIVTIRSVKPLSSGSPIFVTPFKDLSDDKFRIGDKEYEAREIRNHKGETIAWESVKTPIILRSDRAIPYRDGDQFDLADEKDKLLYDVLMDQGVLCPPGASPNPSVHRFYIYDKIGEAKRLVDRGTKVSQALTIVASMTDVDKRNIAYVMKQPVKSMTDVEVSGYIYGLASGDPDKIIRIWNDDSMKTRAFIQRLIQAGILTSGASGIKHGSDVIGLDEDSAVLWMKDKANNERVQMFRNRLKELNEKL